MGKKPKDCGMCGGPAEDSPRSHIFPEWMGKMMQGSHTALVSVPTTSDGRVRRLNSFGLWANIVCDSCEQSFKQADDNYLAFIRKMDAAKIIKNDGQRIHIYDDADQFPLRRFFWTCLFRAHLAKEQQRDVSLGPYAAILSAALLKPEGETSMDVILVRTTYKEARCTGFVDRERMGAAHERRPYFYRVIVPGFYALIKADRLPLPKSLAGLELRAGVPVFAIEQDVPSVGLKQGLHRSQHLHGERASRVMASTVRKEL